MKFGVIAADPPWEFGDPLTMSDVKRGANSQYTTLTPSDVIQLPVKDIAADNAVLALWVPASMISQGLCAVDSWGFEQKQVWVWVKRTKTGKLAFGMGRLARACCEFCLIGVRGKVYGDVAAKNIRNVFDAYAEGHSTKPEEIQDALDSMFPTYKKLELFARRSRPGWTCTGLECPDTQGEDVRDTIARLAGIEEERQPVFPV